jgi:hypothetical protein
MDLKRKYWNILQRSQLDLLITRLASNVKSESQQNILGRPSEPSICKYQSIGQESTNLSRFNKCRNVTVKKYLSLIQLTILITIKINNKLPVKDSRNIYSNKYTAVTFSP